jgi:hypothetical protein
MLSIIKKLEFKMFFPDPKKKTISRFKLACNDNGAYLI